MDETMETVNREFVAYQRLLLRALERVKADCEAGETGKAIERLTDLIRDTREVIET